MSLSLSPSLRKRCRSASDWPVLIRSELMMGLEVAPVAPKAGFLATAWGSTESSHTFVPLAINDCKGVVIELPPQFAALPGLHEVIVPTRTTLFFGRLDQSWARR